MSVFTVASRYAKSLIDLSIERNNLDVIKTDMEQFLGVLKENPELCAVLRNPIMKLDKKRNILAAIFKDKIDPAISSFFNILINKGRAGILEDIAKEFLREYNEVKGIVKAKVTSASALTEEHLAELKSIISKEINADVILTNVVNPSIIGGFVINVGDKQIDASIAGKLNKLEKYFTSQGV